MTVVIGGVRPEDAEEIDALAARCSAQARYGRFLGPVRELPADYRASVLAGDPARHDALVARVSAASPATRPCQVVALASLVAGPDMSELGLLVEDGWQRRGLGTALVVALVARARERGVRYLRATVQPSALGLLVRLGRSLPLERSEMGGYGVTGVFRLL